MHHHSAGFSLWYDALNGDPQVSLPKSLGYYLAEGAMTYLRKGGAEIRYHPTMREHKGYIPDDTARMFNQCVRPEEFEHLTATVLMRFSGSP